MCNQSDYSACHSDVRPSLGQETAGSRFSFHSWTVMGLYTAVVNVTVRRMIMSRQSMRIVDFSS